MALLCECMRKIQRIAAPAAAPHDIGSENRDAHRCIVPYNARMSLAGTIVNALPPRLQFEVRAHFGSPKRYRNLLTAIKKTKATSILEVGVYRGTRSKEMIEAAQLFSPGAKIRYYGFDLFEDLTDELLKSEFSKRPPSQAAIQALLEQTGAEIRLHKGFSQLTMPAFVEQWKKNPQPIDMIFIDGGHAEETIADDWKNTIPLMGPQTVVIFDDYYLEDYSAHIGRAGCQYLIDGLDRSTYDVTLLEPADEFPREWGRFRLCLAQVTLKKA